MGDANIMSGPNTDRTEAVTGHAAQIRDSLVSEAFGTPLSPSENSKSVTFQSVTKAASDNQSSLAVSGAPENNTRTASGNTIFSGDGTDITAGRGPIIEAHGAHVTAEDGAYVRGYCTMNYPTKIDAQAGSTVLLGYKFDITSTNEWRESGDWVRRVNSPEWSEDQMKQELISQILPASCNAQNGSQIYAYNNSEVQAQKGATVHAGEGSRVEALDGCSVNAPSGPTIHSEGGIVTAGIKPLPQPDAEDLKQKYPELFPKDDEGIKHVSAYRGAHLHAYKTAEVNVFDGAEVWAHAGSKLRVHPGGIAHGEGGSIIRVD